jgi:predicted PurR-regulated permease PerM
MLFLPLSTRLEKKGISRGWSSFINVLLFIAVVGGIIALITWQISGMTEDFSKMKENFGKYKASTEKYIQKQFSIPVKKQEEMLSQQQKAGGSQASGFATAIGSSISGFLVDTILVLVYIFLLLFLRGRLKQFILKLVPPEEKDKATKIIYGSTKVASKYLSGLAFMIFLLWVMYGIGFSIAGVKNGVFFGILCGILEIIPFVGNVTGTAITVLMALAQGGGSGIIIGVLVTYAFVQFIQTYVIEPLVVGSAVQINPLFTIISLVVGELIWGVPGMVLAIPVMGVLKVVFDNIEALQPYGYLIGEEKKEGESITDKFKKIFSKSK